ncbi:MAG: rRNA pseudouridine synthase [Clostridia bacterium]|nr:rRNA pseudouridine synthase [Clostridia bacterium]
MSKERLDKLISSQSMMTRSEASKLIRSGNVKVNGEVIKNTSAKADTESDTIEVCGEILNYKKHIYIMLNKPAGIVSASRDNNEKTVVDLVPESLKRPGLFPAGRLDKDTTGFVLITDDGEFAHDILSPKHHIDKTYLASTDVLIDEKYLDSMRNGMILGDEQLLEAEIDLIENEDSPVYKIILREGKYHQIKRMIGSTNAVLTSLRRIRMGNLDLDESLASGECREITEDEMKLIK